MKYTRKFPFCVQIAQNPCVSVEILAASARNVCFWRQNRPVSGAAPMVTKRKQFPNRVVTGAADAGRRPDDAPLQTPYPRPCRQGSFCRVVRIYALCRICVFHPFGGAAQKQRPVRGLPHCRFSAVNRFFILGKNAQRPRPTGILCVRQSKVVQKNGLGNGISAYCQPFGEPL